MSGQNFDVLVLGAGPGGYVAAIRAAQLGFKTAVVEKEHLGGVCLNWGCIPTKALLKSAQMAQELKHAGDHGIEVSSVKLNYAATQKRSRKVADQLTSGIAFLLKKNKVTVIDGAARFKSKSEVEVLKDGKVSTTCQAKHIIIATGGRPRVFPNLEVDEKMVFTSRYALEQTEAPKTLTIIGAGAIGMEFADVFSAFGSQVTILEMQDQLLPIEDADSAKEVTRCFKKRGMTIKTGIKVVSVKPSANGAVTVIEEKGKTVELKSDRALVAVGVSPNSEDLNLDAAGVKTDRGFIKVDPQTMATSTPGIYAIGDVNGPPLLAHVASAEGILCVEKLKGIEREGLDYNNIPGCTYCQPQVASFGLTEKQAKDKGLDVKIGKLPFKAIGKAVALGETDGFVKTIYDAKYGELLGFHAVGVEATEMIHEAMLARQAEATFEEVLRTIHAHPTLGEAMMESTALAYGEAIHF